MNRIFLFGAILVTSFIHAQSFEHEFVGTIQISNEEPILYKLRFNQVTATKIYGESLTDYLGDNSTTSSIQGAIDKKNNVLTFWETSNTNTKSDADASEFCYVHAENIALQSSKKNGIISGSFNGLFPSGKPCAKGNLFLVGENYYANLFASGTNLDSLKKHSKGNLLQKLLKDKMVLTKNEVMKIQWNGSKAQILLWDNNAIDNDVVDIYLNNELIFDNITLTKDKQNLSFKVDNNYSELKICAVSEGAIGLNTLHAILMNEDEVFPVLSSLKKGDCVFVAIAK
jgi:hypothetical protein